jgi:superfamily II DNA or RNA helicase
MKSRDEIQEEALKAIMSVRRGGIAIATGGGKTLLGLKHMAANLKDEGGFLVVAPKISIFNEWKNQAVMHGLEYLIPYMEFTTYRSLDKHAYDYNTIYLDECHSLKDSHDYWLSFYPGKILGLTGSPPRHKNSEKGKMVDKYCPIIYTYKTDEAVADKILNDYRIIVHKLTLDTRVNVKVQSKDRVWHDSEEKIYNYWTARIENARTAKEIQIMRVMRMKAMMGFPSKERLATKLLHSTTEKVLLFANTQEQADAFKVLTYHSDNPKSEENLERFKSGNIKKLACVHQLSEGINIPDLTTGIIMHAYGNERKLRQRLGRLLRLKPEDCSVIHVLMYENTVDQEWVHAALKDFDPNKFIWLEEET